MPIIWTKLAEKDLDDLEQYISQDNPIVAINVVLNIINKVELLPNNPALGRTGRVMGTRELIVAGYPFIVPYRVRDNSVEVLRVLHTSQQFKKKKVLDSIRP